ncbi:hypothetical protein [Microtetraspora glauca]|uniref:SDR family NAD(P)-dependent oxidoreductase n=1 Tax=Microtetraspora glauca TaxID=1996 RepID=A0ABV3GNT1_MICGL
MKPRRSRVVVVTGASTGVGRATARASGARGEPSRTAACFAAAPARSKRR